jgi:outer membrane protein assembly factor BamD
MMNVMKNARSLAAVAAVFSASLLVWNGCGRQNLSAPALNPADQFATAKKIFDKKDYFKAKNLFTLLVLNNPAGDTFERAQYYLAESNYGLKEYVEAISEYEKLIRSMPQSSFVDDAQYKIGLCYYTLAPGYALDQDYTHKALAQFQQFLEDFPDSELRPEAEKRLSECRGKLSKKEFATGELYTKMGYFRAAIISFDAILADYYDTPYADAALFLKGECHLKMGETEPADLAFRTLLVKYPDSPYRQKAEAKLKKLKPENRG